MAPKVSYRGVIEIIGDHDGGKTIAALQTIDPKRFQHAVFVDDDVKGSGTVRQMKDKGIEFGEYIDMASERTALGVGNVATADELLDRLIFPMMNKITSKKRDVIIFDTWRTVYQSIRGHVERNQNKYSNVVTFRGNSTIIQGLISKVARQIEQKFINELRAQCDLLVITHHIKDQYVDNVVAGKTPESSATFSEICNMRIWLRRNPISKVPIMLFLKRPNHPIVVKGELVFTNIVPLKITPTDKHESIWQAIADYENNPIQSRQPRPDETPTADELAAISGTITEEQRKYIKDVIAYNLRIEKAFEAIEVAPSGNELLKESNDNLDDVTDITVPINGITMIATASAKYGFSADMVATILSKKDIAEVIATYKPDDWMKVVEEGEGTNAKPAPKKKKAK